MAARHWQMLFESLELDLVASESDELEFDVLDAAMQMHCPAETMLVEVDDIEEVIAEFSGLSPEETVEFLQSTI